MAVSADYSPRLEVACAVEGEYAFHSAAMLASLVDQRRGVPLRVHYLHGPGFPEDVADGLRRMVESVAGCSISFVFVGDELCSGLPTEGFTGKATWYRIFLPDLLPDLDRVLCLDVDLIALDSLLELWEVDLNGSYLAAVSNVLAPMYMDRPAELGIDPQNYFNAGVMLLDLDRMRRDGCAKKLLEFGRRNSETLTLRDQDALNAILGDRRHRLHPRWNAMNAVLEYPWATYLFTPKQISEARQSPAIRHFEGPGANKPWHYLSDPRWQAVYARYRATTPWPEFAVDGRTATNVVRRYRRRAGYLGQKVRRGIARGS